MASSTWGLAAAGEEVDVTELSPSLLVFATGSGNVVCSVGPDGALLIGTPSATSTPKIASILASRTKSAMRYVVIFPQSNENSQGDAGWGHRRAFVAMQEKALERLGGHAMGAPLPLPPTLMDLGVDRPRIAFSEVLTFDVNGDGIHVVHHGAGYSDADALAHFHTGHLIYFGEAFPGDGYPEIDKTQNGTLDGLLREVCSWAGSPMRFVPARGKVTDGTGLKSFCDVVQTARERVRKMINAGKTEQQILAAHPSAQFDAQWGHGRVSPDKFVRELYEAMASKQE